MYKKISPLIVFDQKNDIKESLIIQKQSTFC